VAARVGREFYETVSVCHVATARVAEGFVKLLLSGAGGLRDVGENSVKLFCVGALSARNRSDCHTKPVYMLIS
jgi:hypothetical protein